MWIRTQNKQMLINTDQILNIYINNSGKMIYAMPIENDTLRLPLGEYENRDDCLRVLDVMTIVVGNKACEWMYMPDDNDIEGWAKRIESQIIK